MAMRGEIEKFLASAAPEERAQMLVWLLRQLPWCPGNSVSSEILEALRAVAILPRLDVVVLHPPVGHQKLYRALLLQGGDGDRYFGGAALVPGTHYEGQETTDSVLERVLTTQLSGLSLLEMPVNIQRVNLFQTPRGGELSQLCVAVSMDDFPDGAQMGQGHLWVPVVPLSASVPEYCRQLITQATVWFKATR